MTVEPASTAQQRWLTLIAALLGWGLDGVEMGVLPVVARPALIELLGGADEQLIRQWNAGLAVMFLLGAAVGGALFGQLGDHIGRAKALALSVLVYAGLTGVGALCQTPAQLALCRFLAATGMGGEWALGVALVVETWPESARPWLAGSIGAAVNVGYIGVALLAGYLDPTRWRLILACCAAPALLTLFVRGWVPESPRWLATRTEQPPAKWSELFLDPLAGTTLAGTAAAGFFVLAVWGAVQFTQLWAEQISGRHRAAVEVQLVSASSAALGALIAPPMLAKRSRRGSYAILCMAAFLAAEGLFLLVTDFGIVFLTSVGILGALTGAINGWLALYLPELFPTRLRATGQGICYNGGRLAAALGVGITAGIGGSYAQVAAVVSVAYLLGAVAAVWLPETRGRKLN